MIRISALALLVVVGLGAAACPDNKSPEAEKAKAEVKAAGDEAKKAGTDAIKAGADAVKADADAAKNAVEPKPIEPREDPPAKKHGW